MKPSETLLGLLRIPVDCLMGMLAFLAAYQIRSNPNFIPGLKLELDPGSFPSPEQYNLFSATALGALLVLFALNHMYSLKTNARFGQEIGRVILLTSAWLMLIIAYFFVIREFPFSRLVLAYSAILMVIFISIGRAIIKLLERFLLEAGIGKRHLLFIGSNSITEKLARSMRQDLKYKIVGLIDDHLKKTATVHALGKVSELSKIVRKHTIEEIIQTKSDLSQAQSADILDFCRENHIAYSFVPDLLAVHQSNIEVETLNGIPVIKLKPTPLDGWGRVIKRVFDFSGALTGLVILSPILALIALAIKIDSRGTVFFKYLDDGTRVKRVGEHGKLFHCYKFRTMYPKTHNLRYTKLAEKNTREGSPLVKIKDDPRITRVGRFLRKTSLDEFPQLINVLKGEISLVGPRPHLPEEVAQYQKHHKFVLEIKPGITGLAQISGRSDLDFEEEIRLDTYYIEHWSLWLDIKILLRTFSVVFKGYKE